MADFARRKATRGFTERECQTYFESTCEQFEERLET